MDRSLTAVQWQLCCVALAIASMGVPTAATAQHPFAPGVAFGAFVFPHVDGNRTTWAVQFDLFTEFSKDLDPYDETLLDPTPPDATFQKYNAIDRTLGFNQFGRTQVHAFPLGSNFFGHLTWYVSGGVVWDTPTEFLQNHVAHGIRNLTHVPRGEVKDHLVLSGGGELVFSWPLVVTSWLDVVAVGGGGGGLSTSYIDGYGLVGAEATIYWSGMPRLKGGGLGRLGATDDPMPGWDGLAPGLGNGYGLAQAWGLVHLDSMWAWFPNLRVVRSWSDGPFIDLMGDRILENFWTFRFETTVGSWAMEMWNDLGFKDLGPTFGFRAQWHR